MKLRKFGLCSLLVVLFGAMLCGAVMAEEGASVDTIELQSILEKAKKALPDGEDRNEVMLKADDINYDTEGRTGDSENDAYILDSKNDFAWFVAKVNAGEEPAGKYYRLEIDDLMISNEGGFANWDPIGLNEKDGKSRSFKGHFDGNGKTIYLASRRNEQENKDNNATAAALFGIIDTASGYAIKDLNVEGYVIGSYTGGIVVTLDSGTIQDCTFSGGVAATGLATSSAGGIAAVMSGGSITRCTVVKDTVIAANGAAVGGIVGVKGGGSVTNCQADPVFEGSAAYKGGIIGMADSRSGVSGNKFTGADKEIGFVESENKKTTSSSGGGCSAGTGVVALAALAAFALRRK